MKFSFLSQNNTAPFMLVAVIYTFILLIPFIFFLNLKGHEHTSGSVELFTRGETDTQGIGQVQLNEFDDETNSSVEYVLTKNVKRWKLDADSRGFILLTRLSIFSCIMGFGAIGAAVSVVTRIRSDKPVLQNITILEILSIQTIGAIFAGILGLAFMGNLLSGAIFPNPSVFYRIIYIPAAFSKLLVWSFIAGFSERFVPNILNNLISKAENSTSKTQPTDNKSIDSN